MFSNRLVLVVVGAGCIAAAGVGGYIAARQTTTPAPVAAATQAGPATASPQGRPVQETEAVVGDTAKPSEQIEAAPAATPKSPIESKRAETTPRTTNRQTRSMQARQDVQLPGYDRPYPSGSMNPQGASQLPPAPVPAPPDASLPPQEPSRAPEPQVPVYRELVVSADSVIGLQTETALTSERARVEDRVEARVTRDVRVGSDVAIPAGSRAIGSVTVVERGGKFKERARLGVRFHTIVLADGTRLPISTDTLYREGDAPGDESAKKIGGGAVGGAIIGAILGGAKGAVIGATTGGAAGAGVVAAGDRSAATLPSGSPITVRLLSPVTVTLEK